MNQNNKETKRDNGWTYNPLLTAAMEIRAAHYAIIYLRESIPKLEADTAKLEHSDVTKPILEQVIKEYKQDLAHFEAQVLM